LVRNQESTIPSLASRLLSYDWDAIGAARRRNFLSLTALLRAIPECGVKFELMWPELDDYDVPQSLPIRIIGPARDQVYARMNEDGFGVVSLYHTLIGEVRKDFVGLNHISRHITNFPVHQDVNVADFATMVASFRRHLADG
jgi:hypothetical protein